MTDFETQLDRSRTSSEKWNRQVLLEKFGTTDVLPFWVADMDFAASAVIRERLAERVSQSDFGYEIPPEGMFAAVADWFAARHDWAIDRRHICFSESTLNGIAVVLELFSQPGDGVIIQPPVYFQFQSVIERSQRSVVTNPLQLNDGCYQIDFEDLEQKAAAPETKILLLCNPHNPVGRAWRRGELQRVADICLKHNVLVVSDEVHADFVFDGHCFTPFGSLSPEVAQQSMSCLSAAKTFNIPAITNGFVVIANDDYRARFRTFSQRMFLGKINSLAAVATEAAYRAAGTWVDECVRYVERNANFLRDALRQRVPEVRLIQPESTFMTWLDFRLLNMPPERVENFLISEARLGLKAGHSFGKSGEGFARMAIGCPRSLLQDAVSRLEKAVIQYRD